MNNVLVNNKRSKSIMRGQQVMGNNVNYREYAGYRQDSMHEDDFTYGGMNEQYYTNTCRVDFQLVKSVIYTETLEEIF